MKKIYIVTTSYPRTVLMAFETKYDALALSEKVNKHDPDEYIEEVGLVSGFPIAFTSTNGAIIKGE